MLSVEATPVSPEPSPENDVASNGLLDTNFVPECEYKIVALAPSILIPAPSAALESAAPDAITIVLSSTVSVVELIVVVVPSTVKLPETVNA